MGDWAQGGRLAKIDYRTGEITYYTPPTPMSGPSSPGVDVKRNLVWFSETPADAIARFDPRTSTFVEFRLPTWRSLVRRIEVDRSGPNRVWFAGSGIREDDSNLGYDKIGYLEILN
jgi:streptogramin lyase